MDEIEYDKDLGPLEEDDELDVLEDFKEQETENSLNNITKEQTTVQYTPFGSNNTGGYFGNPPSGYNPSTAAPFGSSNNFSSNYSTNNPFRPAFGTGNYSNPFQNTNPFGAQSAQSTAGFNYGGNGKTIDRTKKIIICDFLDILIESWQVASQQSGRKALGIKPRGTFDIRLKLEVWDKLKCFGPEYIMILSNINISKESEEQRAVYDNITKFVSQALAEYLELPYSSVTCFTKIGFEVGDPDVKPNTGLIDKALYYTIPIDDRCKYSKKDLVVIGAMSGMLGQNDKDAKMAENYGVEYIDVGQLLNYT